MDRLNQIRGEAGSSRDPTLDTTSPPSEAFMTANESSSKYFSLSEVDSTFSISPSKDSLTTSADPDRTMTVDSELISNLSPIPKKSDLDSYKIGKQIEAANILSGGVNIFDDNDNSYDGDELVIDDNVLEDDKGNELKLESTELGKNENLEPLMLEDQEIPSKTEVVLQIDGKNVDAIDIGNGLYLYRKAGQEELAAVQIIDDDQQQPSFKFLKVRENTEGNLEVYEEIEIEIPKEVPVKEGKQSVKTSHVPIKDISKVISEPSSNKITEKITKIPKNETSVINDIVSETVETQSESKTEVNLNGKMMKFNESRKSPLIGTFKPMTYHSTPNKEGIPLTKIMVDQQLHPSRHSDNVKKTIEVHTDSCRTKLLETPTKSKEDSNDTLKTPELITDREKVGSVSESLLSNPSKDDNHEPTTTETTMIPDSNNIYEPTSADLPSDSTKDVPDSALDTKNGEFEKATVIPSKELEKPEVLIETLEKNEIIIPSKELEKPEVLIETEKNEINPTPATVKDSEIIEDKEKVKNHQENATLNDEVMSMEICDEITNNDIKDTGAADISNTINDEITPDEKLLQTDIIHEGKKEEILTEPTKSNEDSNIENKDNNEQNGKKNELTQEKIIASEEKSHIELDKPINNFIDEGVSNYVITDKIDKTMEDLCKNTALEDQKICTEEKFSEQKCPFESVAIASSDVTSSVNENVKDEKRPAKYQEMIKAPIDKPKIDEECKTNSFKDGIKDIPSDNTHKKKKNENQDSHEELKEHKSIENNKADNVVYRKEIGSQENSSNYVKDNISDSTKTLKEGIKTTNSTVNKVVSVSITDTDKKFVEMKKEIPKPKIVLPKPINNNNSAVPFGKWTEANRQEFLNKIKETKIPSNYPNTKQIKQPNDLNRRDVLKKMDSQRQSAIGAAKVTDFGNMSKSNTKVEMTAFTNKPNITQHINKQDAKITLAKVNTTFVKQKPVVKKVPSDETQIQHIDSITTTKKPPQRKEINNQDLIDKTIEGIINRAVTGKSTSENMEEKGGNINTNNVVISDTLDDIEKKMNELHGIPFEERSAHEMSQMIKNDAKKKMTEKPKVEKTLKIPNLVPFKNKDQIAVKDKISEEISDEEIIEHEPITGDIDINKQNLVSLLASKEKSPTAPSKEAIITEKDFDKFARRNSITYENCLTMSFDSKESHNVIQTIVEKDAPAKKLSRNELMLAESKAKSVNKQQILLRQNNQANKIPTAVKPTNVEDTYTKNYQSKVQMAYQSVMTAKQNSESPITIIEDKPVKVVYMDSNMEYSPMQLNIQGRELSPLKKQTSDSSDAILSASESLDSDTIESHTEIKSQDDTKIKSKHQRKQVLTPVEEPEIELIEPGDLGIEISPKKKRKLEDKSEKVKNLVPKKSYLLNRKAIDEEVSKPQDLVENTSNNIKNTNESLRTHTDAISAIDNLVKAAELIENQAEKKNTAINISNISLDNSLNTPVKRGRGRPRKYPLPDQASDVKSPSPQKKPRLIDAKVTKNYTDSEDSSDGEIVKENWTMGKINENIVCPICNKLFRSENVVFKHVKHCTGPSPNRSDSDQRSPNRLRRSSGRKSRASTSDFTDDEEVPLNKNVRSRKSRRYSSRDHDDVIVIEDTPIKEKEKSDKLKYTDTKKNIIKQKVQPNTHNLICEFCGKTFRQLSYLVNHKMQHKKDDIKPSETDAVKSVFSCEVCKKEFRKLHHLVQHRIIHNTSSMPSRQHRKSSSEHDSKSSKSDTKPSDDASAGFRCEPCDKSFRKLHHLVEHRETHDGINKKGTSNVPSVNDGKPSQGYQCDVCKKVYKKLQDFLEHKEQHMETSSEKSDDKSVKSSLSTKDIIHECSLCYMVFPNEHSLNKHTIICLRKKKQSAAKQAAKKTEEEKSTESEESKPDENVQDMVPNELCQEVKDSENDVKVRNDSQSTLQNKQEPDKKDNLETITEKMTNEIEKKKLNLEPKLNSRLTSDKASSEDHKQIKTSINNDVAKSVKIENIPIKEYITIPDTPTPKKKLPVKEKTAPTVTKRHKTLNVTLPVVDDVKTAVDSSDDDEVRYMLNPNFKDDEGLEAKVFMKVRAQKRNSLQIERPNSKDLIKRRISLQHPPKIPRLKVKAIEPKPVNSLAVEKRLKLAKTEPVLNTDSDDSDVKYSFPVSNSSHMNASKDDKKSKKLSIGAKRKSLSGIAKRKSLGKHKLATPIHKVKKRTTEIEHRCDCGQLFSSAALLSRHTTLAHTPPRIRRRRSPPPDVDTQIPKDKDPNRENNKDPKPRTNKPKQTVQSKKLRSDVTDSNTAPIGVGTRKSSVNTDAKTTSNSNSKTASEPIGKVLRSAAHRGVPVPEKMRKLMEKSKK